MQVNDKPTECQCIDVSTLKTGDILGCSYERINGYFISTFSKSTWSHTGIIWISPETLIPYVLDAGMYKKYGYQNVSIIPFDQWMYIHKNILVGLTRYNGPEIDAHLMMNYYLDIQKRVKLERISYKWLRFLSNTDYNSDLERAEGKLNQYTCYEISIILLQLCNVYKKEKMASSFFPDHLMNSKIECENGIFYDRAIRIEMTSSQYLAQNQYFSNLWETQNKKIN